MSSQLVGQGLGSNWQSFGTGDPAAGEPRPPRGTWRGDRRGLEMSRDRAQKWQILLRDIGPGATTSPVPLVFTQGFLCDQPRVSALIPRGWDGSVWP